MRSSLMRVGGYTRSAQGLLLRSLLALIYRLVLKLSKPPLEPTGFRVTSYCPMESYCLLMFLEGSRANLLWNGAICYFLDFKKDAFGIIFFL